MENIEIIQKFKDNFDSHNNKTKFEQLTIDGQKQSLPLYSETINVNDTEIIKITVSSLDIH